MGDLFCSSGARNPEPLVRRTVSKHVPLKFNTDPPNLAGRERIRLDPLYRFPLCQRAAHSYSPRRLAQDYGRIAALCRNIAY
jgi:hypothetical protein